MRVHQEAHPDVVPSLSTQLKKLGADGRSRPGPKEKNDVPVMIQKKNAPGEKED